MLLRGILKSFFYASARERSVDHLVGKARAWKWVVHGT